MIDHWFLGWFWVFNFETTRAESMAMRDVDLQHSARHWIMHDIARHWVMQ